MAPYSSTLAWKIPWMEESGRLWSMGSKSDLAAAAALNRASLVALLVKNPPAVQETRV